MITGNITIETSKFDLIIREFTNSQFEFHPTGSRYFGGMRENSDWDFITEYNESVMIFLGNLGFQILNDHNYNDHSVVIVMRGKFEKSIIDIQLTESSMLPVKLKAQEILKKIKYIKPTDAEWNLMIILIMNKLISN